MGVALGDQADEIAHIPLLDLMDALGAPVGNDVPPQETCYSSIGPDPPFAIWCARPRFTAIVYVDQEIFDLEPRTSALGKSS